MNKPISVVINTFNEAENIGKLIRTLGWADELIICDMHSDDDTAVIAKKLGARVFLYQSSGYVEPARNFAISKAKNDWILLLDADELLSEELVAYLQELVLEEKIAVYNIARKNIIFGSWMKASFWWPDYQPRLFQKKMVSWRDIIHSKPNIKGEEMNLPDQESLAIIHNNYQTISQFIKRLDRYSGVQAQELLAQDYKFNWKDLITKPISEFLTRFFANQGYKDGLHGLSLSLLQAFSFLVVYLKVWESNGFNKQDITLLELQKLMVKSSEELEYWFDKESKSNNLIKKILKKMTRKI